MKAPARLEAPASFLLRCAALPAAAARAEVVVSPRLVAVLQRVRRERLLEVSRG